MANVLTLNAADSCKFLTVGIKMVVQNTTQLNLQILNGNNEDVSGTVNPLFTLTSSTSTIVYPISISNLTASNGVITIILKSSLGGEIDRRSVVLHCDIDCCLTKLTNELIDCACDCAKCASSLAKAQKIFLLLKSSDYAIMQANGAEQDQIPGFIQDAQSKYLKAKEICDESCGCDC
jgi:hypothetical protein